MGHWRLPQLIALSLSIFLIGPAAFANLCSQVHHKIPLAETSVEIETELTPRVSALLTSKDGRVLSLFDGKAQNHPKAQELLEKLKSLSAKPLETMLLDDFHTETRAQIMTTSIISQGLVFQQSAGGGRVIPHLQVKPELAERFGLREKIDLGSPETTTNGKMIELHLRSKGSSGDLLERAASIYQLMGYKTGALHMHIVMNLPSSWIQRQPQINTWRFVEYWRRVNLFFEMRDVVEKGVAIIENSNGNYMNFAPLQQKEISYAFTYLTKATKDPHGFSIRPRTELGSASKMGWVGFWGHDKYDVPNQMGFEFRFLTGSDNTPEMRRWLSDFPRQIQDRDFRLEPTQLEEWLVSAFQADLRRKQQSTFLGPLKTFVENLMASHSFPDWGYKAMSPHQDVGAMLDALPYGHKKYLLGMNPNKVINDFRTRGRLRYLIHDWAMDPLLHQASEAQLKKIEDAQLRALRKYAQGKHEAEVVQEFLIESDLYFVFAQSLGFNP